MRLYARVWERSIGPAPALLERSISPPSKNDWRRTSSEGVSARFEIAELAMMKLARLEGVSAAPEDSSEKGLDIEVGSRQNCWRRENCCSLRSGFVVLWLVIIFTAKVWFVIEFWIFGYDILDC